MLHTVSTVPYTPDKDNFMARSYQTWRGRNQPGKRVRRRRPKRRPTQAKQVRANTRVLAKITRELYTWRQYQITNEGTVGSEVHTDLITQPTAWTASFQTHDQPIADTPRQYNLKSIHANLLVQTENSDDGNVHFQCFIVSMRPKFAMQTQERLQDGNLEVGRDYLRVAAGTVGGAIQGNCGFYLNPALYKKHWTSGPRRIGQATMGAETAVTNIRDSTYQARVTIPFKRTFKVSDHRDNGYRSLDVDELRQNNKLYMIMLSNSGVGETFIAFNYFLNGNEVAQ